MSNTKGFHPDFLVAVINNPLTGSTTILKYYTRTPIQTHFTVQKTKIKTNEEQHDPNSRYHYRKSQKGGLVQVVFPPLPPHRFPTQLPPQQYPGHNRHSQ